MASLSRLVGSPWHTEKMTRAEGDDRRHRSRCAFYNKKTKYCSKTYAGCYGASHCSYYQEVVDEVPEETAAKPKPAKKSSGVASISYTDEQKSIAKRICVLGAKCKHKTYGTGTVASADDKYVVIRFESGIEKKMVVEFIVKNNLITLC